MLTVDVKQSTMRTVEGELMVTEKEEEHSPHRELQA